MFGRTLKETVGMKGEILLQQKSNVCYLELWAAEGVLEGSIETGSQGEAIQACCGDSQVFHPGQLGWAGSDNVFKKFQFKFTQGGGSHGWRCGLNAVLVGNGLRRRGGLTLVFLLLELKKNTAGDIGSAGRCTERCRDAVEGDTRLLGLLAFIPTPPCP